MRAYSNYSNILIFYDDYKKKTLKIIYDVLDSHVV